MPDGPPYTAGDEMTCSSDGYPAATYAWTVNASPDSTASTQDLQDGEHTYVCTATVTFNYDTTCSSTETRTETAYSKYQKKYNTIVTILVLISQSEFAVVLPLTSQQSTNCRLTKKST